VKDLQLANEAHLSLRVLRRYFAVLEEWLSPDDEDIISFKRVLSK